MTRLEEKVGEMIWTDIIEEDKQHFTMEYRLHVAQVVHDIVKMVKLEEM